MGTTVKSLVLVVSLFCLVCGAGILDGQEAKLLRYRYAELEEPFSYVLICRTVREDQDAPQRVLGHMPTVLIQTWESKEGGPDADGKVVTMSQVNVGAVMVDSYELNEEWLNDRGMLGTEEPEMGHWGGNGMIPAPAMAFGNGFPYLPEKAVAPGDKWTEKLHLAHFSFESGIVKGAPFSIEWTYDRDVRYAGRPCAVISFAGSGVRESGVQGVTEHLSIEGVWYFDVEAGLDVEISYSLRTHYEYADDVEKGGAHPERYTVEKRLSEIPLKFEEPKLSVPKPRRRPKQPEDK